MSDITTQIGDMLSNSTVASRAEKANDPEESVITDPVDDDVLEEVEAETESVEDHDTEEGEEEPLPVDGEDADEEEGEEGEADDIPEDLLEDAETSLDDATKGLYDEIMAEDEKVELPQEDLPTFAERQFVESPEQLLEIIKSPESFNEFANNLVKDTIQQVIQAIPTLTSRTLQRQTSVQQAAQQFYAENSDLAPYRDKVSQVFRRITARRPDMAPDEILKNTAKLVRHELGLTKKAQATETERQTKKKPTFAGRKKRGAPSKATSQETPQSKKAEQIGNMLGAIQ